MKHIFNVSFTDSQGQRQSMAKEVMGIECWKDAGFGLAAEMDRLLNAVVVEYVKTTD